MTKNDTNLFHVQARSSLNKSNKTLRNEAFVPANIFGLKLDSQAIACSELRLNQHLQKEGRAGLIYLSFDDAKTPLPVLIDELQHHPYNGKILHVSFRRVNLNEAVETEVSIELIGETNIPDANVLQVLDSIRVSALPADIPEKIELNISGLSAVGQSILLRELPIDLKKIKLMVDEEELEKPVVLVQAVVEEVEPEVVEEVTGEEAGEGAGDEEKADSGETKTDQNKSDGEAKVAADSKTKNN